MANNIVISRIQNRRGRRENLPQPLLPAEVALTSDTRQTWIGQDPTLAIANVNVYGDKLEATAQNIIDNNIAESKFSASFNQSAFNILVTELTGSPTPAVVMTDADILWDSTQRGIILTISTITTAGTGYTTGDAITAVSSTGSGFVGAVVAVAGAITGVTITSGGINYKQNNTTFAIATGTGGEINLVLTDVHGSSVLVAADLNISANNTVANIATVISGIVDTLVANNLIGTAAYSGTFVSNSLIVNNHIEAANLSTLINRVNSTTPSEITGLVHTGLNLEITGAGTAGSALGSLSDVDTTGAADNDMLFRSGGNWIDTAGELTWDAVNNRLQLANAHSINWLNIGGTSTKMATFEGAVPGGTPATDPNIGNVTLLVTAENGVTGAETFVSDIGNHTFNWVATNGVQPSQVDGQVSILQAKFGTKSIRAKETGGAPAAAWFTPTSTDFDFGNGDFTIEFHGYVVNQVHGSIPWITRWVFGQRCWTLSSEANNGRLNFSFSSTGSDNISPINQAGSVSPETIVAGQWYHIAVTRSGNTYRVFVDGVIPTLGVATGTSAAIHFAGTSRLEFMAEQGGAAALEAHMDNIRITKGFARYTANFTPPAAPFDGSGSIEAFVLGDPAFDTQIDGLDINLLANAGAGQVALRSGTGLEFRDSASDAIIAAYNYDGTDFNTAFTGPTDWNITGIASINTPGSLRMTELAAAFGDVATQGQFWVRNDVPNTPMFTDDAGTDFVLTSTATITVTDTVSTSTFITMTDNPTGAEALLTDGGLTYNASTAALTATTFIGTFEGSNANGPTILDEAASATNPTVAPDRTDLNSGMGSAAADSPNIIAGGIEAMRFIGDATDVIISNEANVGLTADTGSAQGNGVITSSFNVYSTAANIGDAATLPATFPVGTRIYIKNDGANSMDVFPASGDNAGAGLDTAVPVANGTGALFLATVADSTWTQML